MKRLLLFGLFVLLATMLTTPPAMAGMHLLPRVRMPKINLGKGLAALAYPVTKSLVNGGKTVLKVGEVADKLGLVPSIGPPAVNSVVKKVPWGVGRH